LQGGGAMSSHLRTTITLFSGGGLFLDPDLFLLSTVSYVSLGRSGVGRRLQVLCVVFHPRRRFVGCFRSRQRRR
ncbi:hypothetical protein A2U01_0067183, partial [Trifolium medium]|nr:hypothetical protein [Trifolium medium]